MRVEVLQWLMCPETNEPLELAPGAETASDGHVMRGTLSTKAGKRYDVVDGVPVLIPGSTTSLEKETADRFAEEWHRWSELRDYYEKQFLDWVAPVSKEDFKDKLVFEGGCGKGRHTKLAAEWGAKEVVGIDLGDGVESAFALTRDLPNAHIVQCDIFKLPLKRAFDYAFSVGVLHHTPDPKKAFVSLASRVKKGGHISAWVYGAENNEWITKYVNPIRESFTSKMSQPMLYQLSKLPTLSLFLTTKLVYRPANIAAKEAARHLFYNDYLNHLGTFGWREQHNIVFDHLVAPTAFYISKTEFEDWWKDINAQDLEIFWHNSNSWCGFGKV